MCILQGDDGDWNHEAGSMASIYKNATFTIVAAKCQGSHDSLFSDPAKSAEGAYIGKLPGGVNVRLEEPPQHGILRTRFGEFLGWGGLERGWGGLLDRGWVYQEVLLSPRALYFLHDEIMWRCQEHRVCQCARYDADDLYDYDKNVKAEHGSTGTFVCYTRARTIGSRSWASIITDYGARQLTFAKDRLPALAGVAEHFGKERQWTYLCGLWQQDISNNLSWYRYKDSDPGPRSHDTRKLPTWSWASIGGRTLNMGGDFKHVEFESCHITYNDAEGNPYLGDVKDAVLTIKADVFPAKLIRECDSNHLERSSSMLPGRQRYGVSIMAEYFLVLTEDCILDESILEKPDVLCLALGKNQFGISQGLVLYCVDSTNERYERLGWIGWMSSDFQVDWRSWNVARRKVNLV